MSESEEFFYKIPAIWKKLAVILFLLFIFNIGFVIFYPEVYANIRYLAVFVVFNIVFDVDILIRPLFFQKGKKDLSPRTTMIIILLDITAPFWTMAPYLEYIILIQAYFSSESLIMVMMWTLGICLMVVGGMITLVSRITLGKFGTPTVITSEQHELITRRTYRYVRHPIYFGTMLFMIGYPLAFCSFVSTAIMTIFITGFHAMRMKVEEEQLIHLFGDEYRDYMKRTKRYIPFLY
ncbi:MAG: methyltransferase family protein [Candidatus Odinarchaeota archaeon]